MGIHKSSAATIRSFGFHYTTVTNEVMALITNPDALSIWVYLMSKPGTWTPRETELRDRWGIGKDRYMAAMRHLKEIGLAWVHMERDGSGRIVDRVINIGSIPLEYAEKFEDLANSRKTLQSDSPTLGETDPLVKDRVISKVKITNLYPDFYSSYPKKQSKADGLKAWLQVIDSVELAEQVIQHVRTRDFGSDPKYIPLPATFLRGRRWEDELSTPNQSENFAI